MQRQAEAAAELIAAQFAGHRRAPDNGPNRWRLFQVDDQRFNRPLDDFPQVAHEPYDVQRQDPQRVAGAQVNCNRKTRTRGRSRFNLS